jgi:hypothetical protein
MCACISGTTAGSRCPSAAADGSNNLFPIADSDNNLHQRIGDVYLDPNAHYDVSSRCDVTATKFDALSDAAGFTKDAATFYPNQMYAHAHGFDAFPASQDGRVMSHPAAHAYYGQNGGQYGGNQMYSAHSGGVFGGDMYNGYYTNEHQMATM